MKRSVQEKFLNPAVMLLLGLLLGAASRLFDLYTVLLGDIFSRMAIWILLGTLIAVYSPTKKRAMLNILPFCLGMLVTYYAVAILTKGVYGRAYIIGWTVFALFSPLLAYLTWMTKQPGVWPKLIAAGVLGVSLYSSLFLFGGFHLYDAVINLLLAYILFFQKIDRTSVQ